MSCHKRLLPRRSLTADALSDFVLLLDDAVDRRSLATRGAFFAVAVAVV